MSIHSSLMARIHELEAENPGALITLYNQDVRIVYASPRHIESGWTQKDMLGSHWSKFIIPQDQPHGAIAWEDALLNDESAEISVTGVTKTGQRVRMKVRGWRLPDPDTGEHYILVRSVLLDQPSRHPSPPQE